MIVNIIGGGPAGNYLAYLLAEKGVNVKIFEEHETIGMPVQCTGVVTKDLFDLIPKDKKFVTNEINKVEVFLDEEKAAEFEVENYVIDRTRFDGYIANMAKKAGARFFLGHSYLSGDEKEICVKKGGKIKTFRGDILVGADGPLSRVARENSMVKSRIFYHVIQAVVKKKNNEHSYRAYFGKFAPRFFAWKVPKDKNTFLIGIGELCDSKKKFEEFMEFQKIKPAEIQSGMIPVYNPNYQVRKDNIFLLGDAAAQIKASTGGGIIPGLRFALRLKDAILYGKCYNNKDKSLMMNLRFRKVLNRMSKRDYELLLKIMKRKKIRKIIKEYDRDNAAKTYFKSAIADPRVLWFPIKFWWCLLSDKF